MIESLVSGKLHGKPTQRMSKTGRPFVNAKMRVSAGAEGESHFVNVTAFSDTAQAALLALDDGDGVAVAGSLNVGIWTTREGVAAPSISIIAAQVLSVYHLKRKRQAVQGEDGGSTGNPTAPPKRPRSQEPELDAYGDLNDFYAPQFWGAQTRIAAPMNSINPSNQHPQPPQDTDSKPEAWRSTTMLSPSEIESLRQDSKRSKILIREELMRLDKEKASRALSK